MVDVIGKDLLIKFLTPCGSAFPVWAPEFEECGCQACTEKRADQAIADGKGVTNGVCDFTGCDARFCWCKVCANAGLDEITPSWAKK